MAGSGYWWCRAKLLGATLRSGVDSGWVALAARDGTPWIMVGDAAILVELRGRIVGSWSGTVATPWVRPYRVTLVFRGDGTYSAHADETTELGKEPALYWGSDTDSPLKRYSIDDVAADGSGSGEIVLYFSGSETTTLDQLGDIRITGDRLEFSLTHGGNYGPITFQLTRARG